MWISPHMGKTKPICGIVFAQAKVWVCLVGNVEGWGDPVCASRRFNSGGKITCGVKLQESVTVTWAGLVLVPNEQLCCFSFPEYPS